MLVDRRSDLQTAITTFHELWHTLGSHKAIQINIKGKIDWYRSGFNVKSRDSEQKYFYRINEALTGFMTKRFVDEVLELDPIFKNEIEKIKTDGLEVDTTRQGEVRMLHDLAESIYKKNQDVFKSSKDVINLFLKGEVTGNIMPIARVVEKTFGKGSFRRLGEVTQE